MAGKMIGIATEKALKRVFQQPAKAFLEVKGEYGRETKIQGDSPADAFFF